MTAPVAPQPAALPPLDLPSALLAALVRAYAALAIAGGAVFAVRYVGAAAAPGAGFYLAGVGTAALACLLALVLHGRFLDPRAQGPFARDAQLLAARLQGLLAAAFGAKLGVLVVAFFVLRQLGTKFADLATFCVTFAGGALLCQIVTAAVLARSLQARAQRAASLGAASPTGGA
jgi:hypothetical protein